MKRQTSDEIKICIVKWDGEISYFFSERKVKLSEWRNEVRKEEWRMKAIESRKERTREADMKLSEDHEITRKRMNGEKGINDSEVGK